MEKEQLGQEWNDCVWFSEALSFALQNPIPGLESKAGIHTCQWLQSTEDKWIASLVRAKGVPTIEAKQGYTVTRRRGRVQRWGHENFRDFLDEKTGKEPWHLPAATAPLTMEDIDLMSVEEIIIGNLPQSQEHDNSLLNPETLTVFERFKYPQQASDWWLPKVPSATCIVIAMVLVWLWRSFVGGNCGTSSGVMAPGFIPSPDEWEAKVVLLEPGLAFYMRPDTHHAVLTLENSIVKGHHIYATITLAKSVMGWIHTCMLEYRIANVIHPELHELLLHIMCHFYRVMTNDDDKGFHYLEIPEMSRNGLLDIIALGNLCIFSLVLLPCIEESPEQVKIVIATATGAYLSLISSAAHFGRSLIYYSHMAYKLWMHLHDDSNVLHALKSMKNEVNMLLNTFLHIDLTDEFLYTYKNKQKKCLHLCPVFDIRHKEDILDLGIYNECDIFESSQASIKHMEMKDFNGKKTDNEGSFNEEDQSQSGDQDENSEDASGSEYKL
ncbi:hypothetical protein EDD18DRAFT_1108016 [Armillaria luteobubalina]|uniref:JmjC domain-containing protein n=1 Tax=Armillaria luteobubalina TaxID=153913 RepID=A0AA39Q010_9AGAR|nr:hypothetical protein EDD18DRAFT_1108016 [Armillaria luteobubalina]